MNFAVLQFPGSNCEQDCVHVLKHLLHQKADIVWHKENDLGDADCVVVPGGFAHGDYLRTGAVARFSPIMHAVQRFAAEGGLVIGICNGFQILCEAQLLPGALIRNRSLQYRCEQVFLKTVNHHSPFTCSTPHEKILKIPIGHGEGCYFADAATLKQLEEHRQILWQYVDSTGQATDEANPNGSVHNIAGICNAKRNVAGLMPHPDRSSEEVLGSADGLFIFQSIVAHFEKTNEVHL